MKTTTAFAAALAAGMALAPMAAEAATINFAGGTGRIIYLNGRLSGSLDNIPFFTGLGTPRNASESIVCDQNSAACPLYFGTDAAYIGGGRYEGKGDAYLEVAGVTTLLRGTLVQPVTANVHGYFASVDGTLKDVVISEDLAAYYGVPNRGTGYFSIAGVSEYWDPGSPEEGFYTGRYSQGGVTFYPVSPVPVPAALPLMLTALAGLGLIRLRRAQVTA